MHMPGLKKLHACMQEVGIARMRFKVRHSHLVFDGVFLADASPYQFGLACIAHNFALLFSVSTAFEVSPYIHDQQALAALKIALNLGLGGQAFSASHFLQQIDANLPAQAHRRDRALPTDVMRFRQNVEEADKVHLCGWRDNNAYGTNVTPENLDKTRKWIDEATYQWCRKHNISTRWTDDPKQALAAIDKPDWIQYQ